MDILKTLGNLRVNAAALLRGVLVASRGKFWNEGDDTAAGAHLQLVTYLNAGLAPNTERQHPLDVAGYGNGRGFGHYGLIASPEGAGRGIPALSSPRIQTMQIQDTAQSRPAADP